MHVLPWTKSTEWEHLEDVSRVFYLAVNKQITVKMQNVFFIKEQNILEHKIFLKQTRLNYLDYQYIFPTQTEENILK